MMFEIKIHSAVDLITNSSTTIYTFHDGCIGPLKELVNEMLSVLNHTEKFDDIMIAGIFLDSYRYIDIFEDNDTIEGFTYEECINIPRGELSNYDYIKALVEDILHGRIDKPEWMTKIEEYIRDESYADSNLYICAKDPIYQPLCNKLLNFLNSSESAEHYD